MSKEDNPILVEWIDSARPISDWMFLEKKPSMEVIQCVSVGWSVGETDEVLMKPGSDERFMNACAGSPYFYMDVDING